LKTYSKILFNVGCLVHFFSTVLFCIASLFVEAGAAQFGLALLAIGGVSFLGSIAGSLIKE
jgi:hypothetical protein